MLGGAGAQTRWTVGRRKGTRDNGTVLRSTPGPDSQKVLFPPLHCRKAEPGLHPGGGEPHLQLLGVTAVSQVLRQEGSEGPHDVMEGGQCTIHEHTALHQGQTHGQAGQPAGRQPALGQQAMMSARIKSQHSEEDCVGCGRQRSRLPQDQAWGDSRVWNSGVVGQCRRGLLFPF